MTNRLALDQLNGLLPADFAVALGDIFEHAPWVAVAAAAGRPFATVSSLHEAMMQAIREAPRAAQLAFLRGHPELGGKVARAGAMTAESVAEQGSLGLNRLSEAEFARFEGLNRTYADRFGFPFIICVRRQTRDAILNEFERRSQLSPEDEFAAALLEIGHITRLRLVDKVEGPGAPRTEGRLSTHVLDTVSGKPAAGVRVRLFEVGASARSLLTETVTNQDGRTDRPLIGGQPLRCGIYELEFVIGEYFRRIGVAAPTPAFLDVVPLLATPWSYSTYRGS